ncbi:MAG: hypothetical protein LBL78_00975 [Prevotellaceae bacterium]|nr:hypothetical protein [Prevotellaceae bacterium]
MQQRVATGRYTLVVALLAGTAAWVASALWPADASWPVVAGGYAAYLATGLLLIALNKTFSFIRLQLTLPMSVFFLLVAACPPLHRFTGEAAGCVLLLLAVYSLFYSSQQAVPTTGALFYTFAFLGLGSLFFPRLVLFVPLFVLGAYRLQSLTWKSLMGSVVGLLFPCWMLLAYALMKDNMTLFYRPFEQMVHFAPLMEGKFRAWEWAVLGYLLVTYLISMFRILMSGFEGKVSTRNYLTFFGWLCLYLFAYLVLQPADVTCMLPFLLIGNSVLMANYLATTNSLLSNLVFIAGEAGIVALYLYNVVELGWI